MTARLVIHSFGALRGESSNEISQTGLFLEGDSKHCDESLGSESSQRCSGHAEYPLAFVSYFPRARLKRTKEENGKEELKLFARWSIGLYK